MSCPRRSRPRRTPTALSVEEMIEAVKNAGVVGMGGATFPTHVKISGGIGKVNTVIINGAECEPYITGDHRTMLERPEEIIGGATYLAKMFGVDKVVIGVEDNKQNGIDSLNKTIAEKNAPVAVEPLRCRYPQGGEKQLCQAITGQPGASRRPARGHRLRRVQHQHHLRHLPGHHPGHARGEQDRHGLRLRRGGAQERGVPHRHPGVRLCSTSAAG